MREGNKLADFLANIGVEMEVDIYVSSLSSIATMDQLTEFQNIVKNDMLQEHEAHPDAGDSLKYD